MYTYKKLLSIILLIGSILFLFSCSHEQKSDILGLPKAPMEFKADGARNGVSFSATVSLGEEREDGTRGGEIIYSLPDAFKGLSVRTDFGIWEAELDGVKISGNAAHSLGAPLDPFIKKSNAISAELIKSSNGEAQTMITIISDNGKFEFFIDKNGSPILLREKNSLGETVMEFKITEYKIKNLN